MSWLFMHRQLYPVCPDTGGMYRLPMHLQLPKQRRQAANMLQGSAAHAQGPVHADSLQPAHFLMRQSLLPLLQGWPAHTRGPAHAALTLGCPSPHALTSCPSAAGPCCPHTRASACCLHLDCGLTQHHAQTPQLTAAGPFCPCTRTCARQEPCLPWTPPTT